MTKQEFLGELRKRLSLLPAGDIDERIGFYSEMIDDRIEEGCTEEAAVAAIGGVDAVVKQIIADIPLLNLLRGVKENIKLKRPRKGWELALIIATSPIWFSLAVALFSVALSLYAVLWSVIAAFWAVFASFVICGPGGVVVGLINLFGGNAVMGICLIGLGIFSAGLAILAFFGCKYATQGVVWFSKWMLLSIKKCFVKREEIL